ncbi:hypothetical protein [Curtobacterium sp. MCBA15_008]|uniref:hypothetical protein n=1 Tax=Curtobacterium sp. MCBA15_008 TaxID=1898736 RepID=UPI0008DD2293|nr:hypothetical protein [Curtobacterium sp. MCBA15_008]OII09018.1 hypothetical protein BIU96_03695 [Curtobacterium sp. MCBA15_008]
MTDRGNTTHRPELDEQLAHEAQSIVQGHGSNSHVEEFRQSEPVPDDTDDAETVAASGYDGAVEGELLDDATSTVAEDDADGAGTPVYTTETDQVSEGKVVDHGADDA